MKQPLEDFEQQLAKLQPRPLSGHARAQIARELRGVKLSRLRQRMGILDAAALIAIVVLAGLSMHSLLKSPPPGRTQEPLRTVAEEGPDPRQTEQDKMHAEISRLLTKLETAEFDDREAIQKKLKTFGEAARPMLEAGLRSESAEVRTHCYAVLNELNLKRDKIAFLKLGDLWIMNGDGSDGRLVLKEPAKTPHLSPDGKQIVYSLLQTGRIFIVDIDGKNARALTREQRESGACDPSFSPDGQTIVFARTDKSEPPTDEIWLMRADGTEQRKLLDGGRAPVFTPDGKKLIFQQISFRMDLGALYSHIAEFNLQTGKVTRVSKEDLAWHDYPAVSPDGKRIAFHDQQAQAICIMDADGSNVRKLKDSANMHFPVLSPDGTKLLVTQYGESHGPVDELQVLYVMDLDGSNRKRLGSGDQPHWAGKR